MKDADVHLAEPRPVALARAALSRPGSPFRELPERLLVVDVRRQRVTLVQSGVVRAEHPVSTASAGVGGAQGSLRTPPGWHRIHARIGAGEPAGAVFSSRVPTGQVWHGEESADDLILSRVLTLEGLEEGVNRGSGVDSLERYIYLHGTNHERELGRPASHGCVRLSNASILELFEHAREGDAVLIVDEFPHGLFHYAGVAGSGMSALAQFQAMRGGTASGSDRAFDRGERVEQRAQLERMGIRIFPQDGSGVRAGCDAVVLSTAVEEDVPDHAEARRLGVAILHRSELLAHHVARRRSIAVAGTSGKSTVVAMIFEILLGAGRDPSVITGGELVVLERQGLWGNAWAGASDLLAVEADESDGSLVRYEPAVGVVLNLQRDHKEMSEVGAMFEAFRSRAREGFVVGEAANLEALSHGGAAVFGFGPRATLRGTALGLGPGSSRFEADGVEFTLPVPGRHNVENALAAIAACRAVGVPVEQMATPLAAFHGVRRRFQSLGSARGVEVVDDFAHNPAKVGAALATARGRARRVLAVYQPHGYGPTRFLRPDFVEVFASELRPEDRAWWLEVFYAGGTARRDFSSADITAEIAARGARAEYAPSRAWLIRRIAEEAQPGDLVLVMGARDPSLSELARDILEAIRQGTGPAIGGEL